MGLRRLKKPSQAAAAPKIAHSSNMGQCTPGGVEVTHSSVVDLAEERLEDELMQHLFCVVSRVKVWGFSYFFVGSSPLFI